jgi:hypothetical protein
MHDTCALGAGRGDVGNQHSVAFTHVVADCSVVLEAFASVTNGESVLWQRLVVRRCNAMDDEHDGVAAVKR